MSEKKKEERSTDLHIAATVLLMGNVQQLKSCSQVDFINVGVARSGEALVSQFGVCNTGLMVLDREKKKENGDRNRRKKGGGSECREPLLTARWTLKAICLQPSDHNKHRACVVLRNS